MSFQQNTNEALTSLSRSNLGEKIIKKLSLNEAFDKMGEGLAAEGEIIKDTEENFKPEAEQIDKDIKDAQNDPEIIKMQEFMKSHPDLFEESNGLYKPKADAKNIQSAYNEFITKNEQNRQTALNSSQAEIGSKQRIAMTMKGLSNYAKEGPYRKENK